MMFLVWLHNRQVGNDVQSHDYNHHLNNIMYKKWVEMGCTYISKVEVKRQNRENVTIWISYSR